MATTGAKAPVKATKISDTGVDNPHGHEVNKLHLNKDNLNPKDPNHQFVLSLHERALEAHNGDKHKAASHVLNKVSGYAAQTHRALVKSGHTVEGNTHAPASLLSHANLMNSPTEGLTSHGILHATALGLSGSSKAADAIRKHHEDSIRMAQATKKSSEDEKERIRSEMQAKRDAAKSEGVKKAIEPLDTFESLFNKSWGVKDYELPAGIDEDF